MENQENQRKIKAYKPRYILGDILETENDKFQHYIYVKEYRDGEIKKDRNFDRYERIKTKPEKILDFIHLALSTTSFFLGIIIIVLITIQIIGA